MSGWIKIHRCINNHWLFTEKRNFSKFEAWLDILITVNFADAKVLIKGKLYDVKRGQSILSMESWAKRWNWDKSKVRRFMELLQKDSMIILKTDNTTTHLTVCNYDSYQDDRNADDTIKKRKHNTSKLQTTPIKEEEQEEEQEEEKEQEDNIFDELWQLYTKQGNKKTSNSAFNNLTKKEIEIVKLHIPNYIKNHIDNDKMNFLPHFSTYLNQKRFNDELPYKSKQIETVSKSYSKLNLND